MGVLENYRVLYDKYICDNAKLLIVKYNTSMHNYEYRPFSHTSLPDALDNLSELIIDNMVFYAFSEEEIVEQHDKYGLLDDLKIAAKYAYEKRLPKRINANSDGTTGEVLLDILIQVFEPSSEKIIARAKFMQQGDNSEIKGYDALYFTNNKEGISLWMGQVKTGDYSYCKRTIVDDLNQKYILEYFCKSIYYIADKADKSSKLSTILANVNQICFDSIKHKWSDEKKKQALIDLLKKKRIKIKIPCLLAFTANVYKDPTKLKENIDKSVEKIVKALDNSNYLVENGIEHEIIFFVFPLSDVKMLRSKIINFKKQR